jgi:glycosyltransferase involved in cell wall biosynthesis
MEPQKGVFDFPPLLARLRRQEVPVRLTLVGGHDATLARAFSRYGVADAVTWTGRLPHAECYRPATESDVALLLTRKEAFGMTAIEAMAMGCVPIAYDMRTGCREIIEHQKSGVLVPAGRLDLVASALASLHHDRQRLSALSAGAIDRARTCFASDAVARSLIGFIDEVIERRPRHMPQRDTGEPSRSDDIPFAPRRRGYQRLSSSIRKYAHRILCSHPGLANLVYNQ